MESITRQKACVFNSHRGIQRWCYFREKRSDSMYFSFLKLNTGKNVKFNEAEHAVTLKSLKPLKNILFRNQPTLRKIRFTKAVLFLIVTFCRERIRSEKQLNDPSQ